MVDSTRSSFLATARRCAMLNPPVDRPQRKICVELCLFSGMKKWCSAAQAAVECAGVRNGRVQARAGDGRRSCSVYSHRTSVGFRRERERIEPRADDGSLPKLQALTGGAESGGGVTGGGTGLGSTSGTMSGSRSGGTGLGCGSISGAGVLGSGEGMCINETPLKYFV